jgi:hypothetical protein
MPRNQKLTKVIAGRTIKTVTIEPGNVLVLFDDQSSMKIKTAGPATIPPDGKVKSVHEAKADFKPEFENGSSATFCQPIGSGRKLKWTPKLSPASKPAHLWPKRSL